MIVWVLLMAEIIMQICVISNAFLLYPLMHSAAMDGKTLLSALLAHERTNPYALSQRLKKPSLQSQMQRFLDGATKAPRWDTLAPVAKHFNIGVEAFYTPALAQRIADERGLDGARVTMQPGADYQVGPATVPIPIRANGTMPIGDLVVALGAALEAYDLSARKAVASLLQDVAMQPAEATLYAERIERLLGEPGNGQPRRSTASR